MKRLAIITTHPIQYNAPLFKLLNERGKLKLKVFYTWGETVLKKKFDPGFGQTVQWDIPLLNGYEYCFVGNIAPDPGSHHFKGIDNPNLINGIKNWGADSLLVFGWSFKSHLKTIRYFKGKIPVFFRGDSTLLQQLSFTKKIIRNLFLKWIYSHIDYALYVGTYNKQYFQKMGLKENQLLFAPHAVDNARFLNEAQEHKEEIKNLRFSLGIETVETVFLYAGKLDENKNVQLLADVFKNLDDMNSHLIIAGNGVLEVQLKKSYNCKNIHFLPFQNQSLMPTLLGSADVVVLPSKLETWGLIINEAMACGKPVLVSTGCAAAKDLVIPGLNGYIFKSDDKGSLKRHLQKLLSRKSDLAGMGNKSQEIIQNWNYTTTCEIIEKKLS